MNIRMVEIERRSEQLLEFYREAFKSLFGEKPHLSDLQSDMAVFRRLTQQYSDSVIKMLLQKYLVLNNEFLKNKGYPLSLFENNINAIHVSEGHSREKPLYVIWFSERGFPVVSTNPRQLSELPDGTKNLFEPILWEEWLKQDLSSKLQITKLAWNQDFIYTSCELFKKEGWL